MKADLTEPPPTFMHVCRSLLGNGLVKTLPRQRMHNYSTELLDECVLYAVHGLLKKLCYWFFPELLCLAESKHWVQDNKGRENEPECRTRDSYCACLLLY
jgi:hypothetical protein